MSEGVPIAGLPRIRRARGFRLYDFEGRRRLDLYQAGGGAILGHRGASTVTAMKAALSQGLAAPLPSVWEARLVKQVRGLLRHAGPIRLYSSRDRALDAVSIFLGVRVGPRDLHDPSIDQPLDGIRPDGPRAVLWRPFLPPEAMGGGAGDPGARAEDRGAARTAGALLPVLPLTICGCPALVCFPAELPDDFPPSDIIPGFVLAGAARALADLSRQGERDPFTAHAPLARALDGTRGWAHRGPYVRALFDPADYPRVFDEFLGSGICLSPIYPGPSILPGECSPGEWKLITRLFREIPGG